MIRKQVNRWIKTHPGAQLPAAVLHSKIKVLASLTKISNPTCCNEILFIIGAGRSGNTLMRKLLVESYEIYIPAETYVIPSAFLSYLRASHMPWSDRVKLVLSFFEYHPEFETMSRRTLKSVFDNASRFNECHQTYGNIIYEIISFMAHQSKCSYKYLGDKTPLNTLSLGIIKSSFPNARYLFITRNPYDVVSSYIKMGRYNNTEDAACRWADSHKAWVRFKKNAPQNSIFEARYEDLVNDHGGMLEKIGSWLSLASRMTPLPSDFFWGDITAREHHEKVRGAVDTHSIGRGVYRLDKDQRRTVRRICGPVGASFNYDMSL